MDEEARLTACYEQNCEQFRSLNQIMWQVPMIAMTLTGGLWYAIGTLDRINSAIPIGLLIFGATANIALIVVINRVRFVMSAYMKRIREYCPRGYADASSLENGGIISRDGLVCFSFSLLMGIAAAMSLIGATMLGCGLLFVERS